MDIQLDLFHLLYYSALITIPFILYKIFMPSNHGREKRVKDWYYTLKRIICRRKLVQFMNRKVTYPKLQPKEPSNYWEEDLVTFHGCDLQNNSILIRFSTGVTENFQKFAEILVLLRLSNGKTFTLPEGIVIIPQRKTEWRSKILTIIPQLNGSHRILFNGFLKEMESEKEKVEHFNFAFLFNPATKNLEYPKFFDESLFADAICREQWRNGQWTHKLGDTIGQEQFGIIHGPIKSANFGIDTIWNLVAHQSRRFGTADRYNIDDSISLLSLAKDGTVVHIEKRHISNPSFGTCQVKHGAILLPYDKCLPITSCDLVLPTKHSNLTNMTVHTSTKENNLKSYISINETTQRKLSSDHWSFGYDISTVTGEVSQVGTDGKVSIVTMTRNSSTGTSLPGILIDNYELSPPLSLIVPLDSNQAKNLSLTGGKAQSLAILTSQQKDFDFKVPAGFVITTLAMEQHVLSDEKTFRSRISTLKMAKNLEQVQKACERIQEYVMEITPKDNFVEAIENELQKRRREDVTFAVRSSGVAEDSESSSAAGQNETFLGCKSNEEIIEAVKKCWASLYAFRSVEYRRNRGLDLETTMGVVIQEMIDSRIAGVLFTCDLDGNPSRMRITSNYGLGESIVSGEVGGDLIYIKRTWQNALSVDSMQAQDKKTKITLNKKDKKGTQMIYLNDRDAKMLSISKEEVLKLGKVATQLEILYGRHLDIEWAFENHNLVLLQARPVTFLENWTDYELEHEFDFPNVFPENVFTTANVKEVMPGALTPLSNSTIAYGIDKAMGLTIPQSNLSRRDRLITYRHHIFMNFYQVLLTAPRDEIDMTIKSVDYSICGHEVTTNSMLERAKFIHGQTTAWKSMKLLWNTLKNIWKVDKLMNNLNNLTSQPLIINDSQSVKDILKRLDYHLELYDQVMLTHSLTSHYGNFFQVITMTILGQDGSDLTPEKFTQLSLCFSNGSGVISAEIPLLLDSIAMEIRNSPKRKQFVVMDSQSVLETNWLRENIPQAYTKLEEFLKVHGHRSFREFELAEDSWGRNPKEIVKMLQTLAKLDNNVKKSEGLSLDAILQRIETKVNKKFLKFLISKGRKGIIYRETSKSETVKQVNKLREGFKVLGEQMERFQYLPSKDLIFYLSYDEVKNIVETRDSSLITKAMRRKRLHNKWNEYKFPEMSIGTPQLLEKKTVKFSQGMKSLKGTPVCSGIVTARCCCIDNLKDIGELKQGDVLLTIGTDVGWTPYFPMLSGIVTELGGLISHGAVIAREYGLPSLIGVEGLLNTFVTGDEIVLDADNGCIYKVEGN